MNELLKRVKKINQQIATLQDINQRALGNLTFLDKQSLITERNLMSKQQRNYIGKNQIELFEFDETMNNITQIKKEYDITSDETTGKVWIASVNGDVIIQGVIDGYVPNKAIDGSPKPGAEFVWTEGKPKSKKGQYHDALFSGAIRFENLPLQTFAAAIKQEEKKNEEPIKSKQPNNLPTFPTEAELRDVPAGQLKPPKCSRSEKSAWWTALRERYPNSFDSGGNWIGLKSDNYPIKPIIVDGTTLIKDNEEMVIEENEEPVKERVDPKNKGVPGLLQSTGQGNAITNMVDEKINNGFFLGRFYGKKGYAVISTPAKEGEFEKSAFLICNKEKTAKFLNLGLSRNESFAPKVDGADVFHIRELKKDFFEDTPKNRKILVYWITNAVTALQALGTQEKDIEDIKTQIEVTS